jgi:hypothetical protein
MEQWGWTSLEDLKSSSTVCMLSGRCAVEPAEPGALSYLVSKIEGVHGEHVIVIAVGTVI